MLLGRHPIAGPLLYSLGFESEEEVRQIPRLRDVYLYDDEIRILTRTGGGNRPDYEAENQALRERPGFLRDWDDAYDSTFAWWAFSWPDDEEAREGLTLAVEQLKKHRPDLLPEHLGDRWEPAVAGIGDPSA